MRGELVAIAVGVVFLATAILKPWTDHAAPIQPAPSKALAIVVSPSPSPAASSDLAPWRDGELPRSSGDPFPLFGEITRLWPTVDWALIGTPNSHPAWGIATVAMTELTGQPDATAQAAPTASWVEASPAAPVVVEVPGDQHVYAFAVTWPDRVAVTGLTFEYDGGPAEPPHVSSGVFPPYQQLDPLACGRGRGQTRPGCHHRLHHRVGTVLGPAGGGVHAHLLPVRHLDLATAALVLARGRVQDQARDGDRTGTHRAAHRPEGLKAPAPPTAPWPSGSRSTATSAPGRRVRSTSPTLVK